jgi:ring-1,2-phenylacetyl-CoA epoxidase subunit PaaC
MMITEENGEISASAFAKAAKEAAYHVDRSSGTVIGLGDGTDESHRRMQDALDEMARERRFPVLG